MSGRRCGRRSLTSASLLAAGITACLSLPAISQPATPSAAAPAATAAFVGKDGGKAGTAQLYETPSGVLIRLEVRGLPKKQWVALHAHEHGACSPHDGNKAAGGHFNPTGAQHGYMAPGGPHAGDLPNQQVGADGVLRAEVFAPTLSLGGAGRATSDLVGRTLMIHAKADDYVSQPAGDSGDRLACAPIVRASAPQR